VLDFGLAGTPRYMAPEQAAGAPATAASDQYAFCVALAEALRHRGPIPRWLDAIVTRGTAAEPGERFASMAELLRVLARDPATIWRRRAIAGGALALAGATFVVGSARGSHITPCDGGEAEITSVWSTARTPTIAHLRALGTYGAVEADPVATGLDAYGKDWADAHRSACLAHERHELTDAVYERSLGCLARARTSYETVIDVLGSTTAPRLGNAIAAARSLPAADRCALDSAASIIPPPPRLQVEQADALSNEIERVRVLAATDDPRGGPAASEVVTRATALDYVPLIARAKLALGLALLGQQNAKAAIPVLGEAWVAAIDAFDDVTLVEAYARELYARSVIAKPTGDDSGSMLALVEHVAARSGTAGAFARALLFNNLGAVRLGAGDPTGARAWFDRSLREPGKRDAELSATYANRALVTDDPGERDQLFARARQMLAGLLGENHRKTLDVRFQAAFFIADAARAETELRALCETYRRFHAEVAANTIANCYFELGWLAEARGDREATRRAMEIVADGEGFLPPMARAYLLAIDGKHVEAIAAARRVAEELRDQTWAKFNAADAYRFVAAREVELAQHDAAAADAKTAMALFDQLPHLAKMPHFQRRVARTQSMLTRRSP
jgi:tetratricopeptide (TPR) repeat protein